MFKSMFKKIVLVSLIVFSASANAVDWTANIKSVSVYPDGSANIRLENLTDSSPSQSTLGCDNDWVILGAPADRSLLSAALTAYTVNKQIRVGVEGSGITCTVSYITTL